MRNSSATRQLLRFAAAMSAPAENDESEPLPIPIDPSATPAELVDAFVAEVDWWYARPLRTPPAARQTSAGKAILALPTKKQLEVLYESLQRAVATPLSRTMPRPYSLVDCAGMLLTRDLGYEERDLQKILELLTQLSGALSLAAPLFQSLLPHLERQAARGGLTPETADLVQREANLVRGIATGPELSGWTHA